MKRLYRASRRAPDPAVERCELCAAPLADVHEHLWETRARAVRCACQACAVIIPTSEHAVYRRVPRVLRKLAADPARWLAHLGVPVGVAAVYVRANGDAVAAYPGAIGLVESELDAEAWRALCAAIPEAAALEPEVEAIVWSSAAGGGAWRTGIDTVFKLVSELRARRGVETGMFGDPDAPAVLTRALAAMAETHA